MTYLKSKKKKKKINFLTIYKLHICPSDIQPGTSFNSCLILVLIGSSKILNNGYSSPFEIC